MSTARPRFSQRRRRRLFFTSLVTVLLLGSGGYVAAAALAELPEPTLALSVDTTTEVSASDEALTSLVSSMSQPTAVGWNEADAPVWANDDAAYSIASITKLVTVLVGQEAEPLGVGEDGPTYTWTVQDQQIQDELIALNGVAFPVQVGTEMTRRQMLELALIPSANDFAIAYAYSIFGDRDGFVAAVNDWTARNGLDSIEIHEPSGMDSNNKASAADLVRVVRLVLADPTLAELVSTESFVAPWGIGEVTTTNPLFDLMDGVVGVKTGTTDAAGYNLAGAARDEFEGREFTRISVVLARDSYEARAYDSVDLLQGMSGLATTLPIIEADELIGTLTTIDGQQADLLAMDAFSVTLLPGETASRTLEVSAGTAASGNADTAGTISVELPGGATEVPVRRTANFTEPDLWWRLTNPSLVFGN